MNCSTPGLPVFHYILEFAQTHVRWVSDAIQQPHFLSSPSPTLNLCQYQGVFQWVRFSYQVAKVLELQFQHQSFQWIFRLISFRIDWFDLLSVQGTLRSLLQHHGSKASILQCSAFFMVWLSHPYMTTGKAIALTVWTFVSKVMSLFFNMLSRYVIVFLPRTKHLLISWLQSQFAVILEPKKIKSVTFSVVSPSFCHEVMGPDALIFVFWQLNFKSAFSLSTFTFIKRLFSSSSLYASPVFSMIYTAYKLNKQGDSIYPWPTPFPIWNQSIVPCLVLIVTSQPAYRFLRRKIKWSGIPISWRISHNKWIPLKLCVPT